MYVPKFNQVSDRGLLIEAMRAYSFAIIFGPLDATIESAPIAGYIVAREAALRYSSSTGGEGRGSAWGG